MSTEMTIITNNPLVYRSEYTEIEKIFVESTNIEGVLLAVRDLIHKRTSLNNTSLIRKP